MYRLPDDIAEQDRTELLIHAFRISSYVAIAAMGAIALVITVAGWGLGFTAVRTVIHGAEVVKSETAGAFLAAVPAFWLLRPGSRGATRTALGYACAALVLAAGAVNLWDYFTHSLPASRAVFEGKTVFPTNSANVRSAETGVLLVFGGIALAARRIRLRQWSPYKTLALIPVTVGLYGLVNYFFPDSLTYSTGAFTSIALGTALCSTLLGIGLVLAPTGHTADQPLASAAPAGVQGRRLLAGATAVSVLLGVFAAQADRLGVPVDMQGVIIAVTAQLLLWVLIYRFVGALERSSREHRSAEHAIETGKEEMRRLERESQMIVDSAPDSFVQIDADGRVTRWNTRSAEIFGWSQEEAMGQKLTDLFIPPDYHEPHRAMLRGDDPFILGRRVEVPAVHKDGHLLDLEVEVWRLEEGDTHSFNAFATDITRRKELEQALVAARDEALNAAQAKSRFLATMSHEIRTPMNGVIGLTDLLLETTLTQAQHRYATGIQTAGNALLSVINDILDYSKLDAGHITIDDTTFDPGRLIDEVTDVFANTAASRGLELIGNTDPTLPGRLRGDPTRLRQILLNLTSNALKFTRHGEVIVRITHDSTHDITHDSTHDMAHGGTHDQPANGRPGDEVVPVRFEVTDTGIGIAPEQRDRLFQPFAQADTATTRDFGGTGLGLSICHRLTEAMGGRIGVESSPGAGSTFWCVIPLRRTAEEAITRPPPALNDLRVLIVDDNESNRLVLAEQLRAWHLRPTPLDGGQGALQALRTATDQRTPYDLAIIDMMMPRMNGVELGRRITTDPRIRPLHLILLTSSDDPEPTEAANAGFAATLTKPVHRSALYDRLADVMTPEADRLRPTPRPPPRPAPEPDPAQAAKGRVLVVEDNEINQAVAAGFLTRKGYTADIAADGRHALDKIARTGYDAILMDCQMPIMDGYEATTELRKREGFAHHTPVIAMTADALTDNRDRCIAAGMDDFIPKPISQDTLASTLERWIPPSGQAAPPTTPAVRRPRQPARTSLRQRMEELRGADPGADREAFTRIAGIFITRGAADIEQLADAITRRDAAQITQHAHRIKGAAANIGAVAMAELCAEIENIGRERRLDGAADLLNRLRGEFDQARTALEALVHVPPTDTTP